MLRHGLIALSFTAGVRKKFLIEFLEKYDSVFLVWVSLPNTYKTNFYLQNQKNANQSLLLCVFTQTLLRFILKFIVLFDSYNDHIPSQTAH